MRPFFLVLLGGCLINPSLRDERRDALDGDGCDTPRTWLRDADGDGYGATGEVKEACTQPEGWTTSGGDCDDDAAAVHPGADERCNGLDDDCDGTVDGPASVDATTWFPDGDADGYGYTAGGVTTCDGAPEPTWVTESGDCNDQDDAVHPGADEWCNGEDDDCDGTVDEPGVLDGQVAWADADADGYGDPDAEDLVCPGAPGWVSNSRDCDDTRADVSPSGTDTPLLDGDCDGLAATVAVADSEIWGQDGEQVGAGVAAAGDVNGDGLADWIVGAPGVDQGMGYDRGGVWLVLGTTTPSASFSAWSVPTLWIGEGVGHATGTALAAAGDLDGDGFDDLWVGSIHNSAELGGGWIIPGSASPTGGTLSTMAEWVGEQVGDEAGASVAGLGDVDQDGFPDLAMGAPRAASGGIDGGAVYLIRGGAIPTGERTLDQADGKLVGPAGSQAGASVAGAGDLDGDGVPDLAVGGPTTDGTGAVWIVLGGSLPTSTDLATAASVTLEGVEADGAVGHALDGAGDVDGDGYDDLLIGAPALPDGGDIPGGAYLVRGTAAAPATVSLAFADVLAVGAAHLHGTGASVSGAGDVNGDGFADLLIGAPLADGGDGLAWLVLGTNALPPVIDLGLAGRPILPEGPGSALGASVAGAGDTNGDGLDDLLIGGPLHDHTGTIDGGGAYLVLGQPL